MREQAIVGLAGILMYIIRLAINKLSAYSCKKTTSKNSVFFLNFHFFLPIKS